MKKKYSNSLNDGVIGYKESKNDVHVIGKEDIIAMFKREGPKKKDKFRIFR